MLQQQLYLHPASTAPWRANADERFISPYGGPQEFSVIAFRSATSAAASGDRPGNVSVRWR
jgi:hypothetical protein